MADNSQKTEKPTAHRLKKAREEGRFPTAREFVSALQFVAFVAWLARSGAGWLDQMKIVFHILLERAFRTGLDATEFLAILRLVLERAFLPLASLGGLLVGVALLVQLITTGFGLSTQKLVPDFTRLNPAQKLQSLRRQNVPAFLQAAILLPVFGYVVFALVREHLVDFYNMPNQSLMASFQVATNSMRDLLWKAAGGFVVFGLVNLFRQRRHYNNDLKMSRQDIRDEHKQQEGSPQIKSRVRRLQRDMRRRTMMKDVKKATAVIVNPTHFAVAIRYQMASAGAPTVLAKGKNYLAMRIKQRALDHQIPIIENPPLAQALYKSAEVGQEIPAHLYKAVAEVLAYIYKLMKGRMPGQDD